MRTSLITLLGFLTVAANGCMLGFLAFLVGNGWFTLFALLVGTLIGAGVGLGQSSLLKYI